jgi:hypothetical protein
MALFGPDVALADVCSSGPANRSTQALNLCWGFKSQGLTWSFA